MTILNVLFARIGSTRFPGKVIEKINGKTLIEHCFERLSSNRYDSVVAIPSSPDNLPLKNILESRNIPFFLGNQDPGKRLAEILEQNKYKKYERIIRTTADNLFPDNQIVEEMLLAGHNEEFFFTAGGNGGLPKGVAVEIFTRSCFDQLILPNLSDPNISEHITIHLRNAASSSEIFSRYESRKLGELSTTCDTPSDLDTLRTFFRLHNNWSSENCLTLVDLFSDFAISNSKAA